jgi:hypothetical protein
MGYLIEDWEENYAGQIWDAVVAGDGLTRESRPYLVVKLTSGPLRDEFAFCKSPSGKVAVGTRVRVRAPAEQFTMGDDRWDLVPMPVPAAPAPKPPKPPRLRHAKLKAKILELADDRDHRGLFKLVNVSGIATKLKIPGVRVAEAIEDLERAGKLTRHTSGRAWLLK